MNTKVHAVFGRLKFTILLMVATKKHHHIYLCNDVKKNYYK